MTTRTPARFATALTLALSLFSVGCAHHRAPAPSPAPSSYTYEPAPVVDPILATCDAIQRDRGIPVGCSTRYIRGVPSMIIGFSSGLSSQAWIPPVLQKVALPFCASRSSALVFFSFYTDQVARGYNCRTGEWSPWFSTASDNWLLSSY